MNLGQRGITVCDACGKKAFFTDSSYGKSFDVCSAQCLGKLAHAESVKDHVGDDPEKTPVMPMRAKHYRDLQTPDHRRLEYLEARVAGLESRITVLVGSMSTMNDALLYMIQDSEK